MRNIDFASATFKDFENPEGLNVYERANYFGDYLDYLEKQGRLN